MKFSELLVTLMDERGETAYRLAKEMQISQSTVASWTGGNRIPQKYHIKVLAEHFGINRAEIDAACEYQRNLGA